MMTGICHDCGEKHGTRRPRGGHGCWVGLCLWCDEVKTITAARDFGHPAEPHRDWFFTFGGGHAHQGGYVRIHGTHSAARDEMVRRFGRKWSNQYPTPEEAGIAEFGLHEVER